MERSIHLRRADPGFWRWLFLTVGLVALLIFAISQYFARAKEQSIARLPDDQRAAAYTTTLDAVKRMCGNPIAPALRKPCEHQARLLLEFPECDAQCRELSVGILERPARPR